MSSNSRDLRDLVEKVSDLIMDQGEGLLGDEGVDHVAAKALANEIVTASRLDCATEYEIMPEEIVGGKVFGNVTVKARVQKDGTRKWAVYQRDFMVLTKELEWEIEPIPSSRTGTFLRLTRFSTLDEAFRAGDRMVKEMRGQMEAFRDKA